MQLSEQFKQEKEFEIKKIERQNRLIEKIEHANLPFLDGKNLSKLQKIYEKNRKYKKKLETDEFEIAIVGLEKAGKSTFANALIENNILPSAPERCTFTSTRLTYGDDEAIVEFYTENEFNKIFIELLKEINYPDAEKQHFRKMSLAQFESYFEKLANTDPSLYKTHLGKTNEEIKDILQYKDRLELDSPPKRFFGDELLSEEFQEYIKGKAIGSGTDKIIDTSKPRSAKSIKIKSSKLSKLENAIIYDVPGFDSPTRLHERQTLERLKNADAIILVTNVGTNPSLVGPQLNTIIKNTDDDGIPLKDKLFVFGNQLDRANSEKEAEENINTLKSDIKKYQLAELKRVFTGSAKKYLVYDKKIVDDPDYQLHFEVNSGIEEIRREIENYYQHERFEILKNGIAKNERELKEIFKEILDKMDAEFDQNFVENERHRISRETTKLIEREIENKLRILKDKLKKEIWEERYFAKTFKERLENGEQFKEISDKDVERTKINEDESLTLDIPIEKINHALRKELHKKFLKEYIDIILGMTDEKAKTIHERILETFTNSIIRNETVSPETKEMIKRESEKIIQKLSANISHNEDRFLYLIERFSRDVFDIMILNPLVSTDRKNKFKEAEIEFFYLDMYYSEGEGSLISLVLTGEKSNKLKKSSFGRGGINIDELLKGKERSKTEEQVLQEINKDIENLKDILKTTVVPATNLDLAFFNSVDKEIKLLIEATKQVDTENGKLFNKFIAKVVTQLKKSELDAINQKLEEYQLQQEILKEIRNFQF